MKKLVFLFVLIFSFVACSSDSEKITIQNQSLVGTWQLVEVLVIDTELNAQWVSIDDGFKYTFKKNGEFSTTLHSEFEEWECFTGIYTVDANQLILEFDCEDLSEEVFIKELSFSSDNIFVWKSTKSSCIEGCGKKFQKVEPISKTKK